jgi:hypothetical protein
MTVAVLLPASRTIDGDGRLLRMPGAAAVAQSAGGRRAERLASGGGIDAEL